MSGEVMVQEDLARRARLVHREDGTVEPSVNKYNGKYLWETCLFAVTVGLLTGDERREER